LNVLGVPDLRGKYFLDVGSGSGLSSLAALDAGAARIVSFDVDPHSVETTRKLHAFRGSPSHWQVLHGSALDDAFLASIEPADIVYSWGVLHHTGQMWRAVENTSRLMKADGCFYLALYTTSAKSGYWLEVKKRYNAASPLQKRLMEGTYFLRHTLLPHLLAGKLPIAYIRDYQKSRGMAYLENVRDWLGGYPYEDAKVEEVLDFGRQRLALELVKLATGEACTEYLFTKRS
jgi:2-polyprenyl-6-hydroxyphenyl methylase/3-demethylubiquinone-9 3-methyltransferase